LSEAAVVFDGLDLQPPRAVTTAGICQTQTGSLLVSFRVTDVTRPGILLPSKEGVPQRRRICATRSEDMGKTWSDPTEIDTSAFPRAGITTKPFTLSDGDLCVPLEVTTTYGPNGTAATFSSDDGRTFESPITCVADTSGEKNLCDARFTTLKDGRILMLMWTFLRESEKALTVHRSYSSDHGRTWTPPRPTGMSGQIAAPLALSSTVVLAVSNFRQVPHGIRLYASHDAGETWDGDHPIQMWDMTQSKILAEPIDSRSAEANDTGVWDALTTFTFGTPDLVYLDDGSILMTYYATIDDICHVRACRFRVTDVQE